MLKLFYWSTTWRFCVVINYNEIVNTSNSLGFLQTSHLFYWSPVIETICIEFVLKLIILVRKKCNINHSLQLITWFAVRLALLAKILEDGRYHAAAAAFDSRNDFLSEHMPCQTI